MKLTIRTISATKLKNFFFELRNVVLCFFFIYNISPQYLPFSIAKLVLLSLILIMIPFKYKLIIKYFSCLGSAIFPFVLIGLFYLLITVASGNREYSFIYLITLIIFESCIGSFLISLLFLQNRNVVFYAIAYATLIQAICILSSFSFESVKVFFDSILPEFEKPHNFYFRTRGLSDSASAALSVIQAFGCLSFMHLSSAFPSKKLKYILFAFIVVISNFLVGRTGMIFGFFFIFLYLSYPFTVKKLFSLIKYLFLLLAVCVFVYNCLPSDTQLFFMDYIYPWLLDKDASSSDSDMGRTLELLEDMWLFPSGIYFFIGEGGWKSTVSDVANYVDSDIGYVRMLFAIGFVGMVFFYSVILNGLRYIYKKYGNEYYLLIICLLVFFVFIESKEPFLMQISVLKVLFLLFFTHKLGYSKWFII